LDKYSDAADVVFTNNPVLKTDFGKFNYIHKIKDGKNIFFFTNSSDEKIHTEVILRGDLKLECWNPHNGNSKALKIKVFVGPDGKKYSKCFLDLDTVSSVFWIGN